MKWIGAFAFVIFCAPIAACDFNNPHSFSCQDATFKGNIFPLVRMNAKEIGRTWFTNQFTAGSSEGAEMFSTVRSPNDSRRTCFVRNFDGSAVGALQFRGGLRNVRLNNFRATTFVSNRVGGFEDANTAVFGNTETEQRFRCRIFVRANTRHLTCQYFEDLKFMGYVGFLPFQQGC